MSSILQLLFLAEVVKTLSKYFTFSLFHALIYSIIYFIYLFIFLNKHLKIKKEKLSLYVSILLSLYFWKIHLKITASIFIHYYYCLFIYLFLMLNTTLIHSFVFFIDWKYLDEVFRNTWLKMVAYFISGMNDS